MFRKVPLDVLLSDEFADGAVGLRHHPLPPGLEFLLAVEFLAEEGEVLVDKVVGEGGRRGARAVKGCVREHIFFVNRGSNQGVGRRDERVRPRYVQLAGLSLTQRFEVHAPGKRVVVWQRLDGCELVISAFRVSPFRGREVGARDGRLEFDHPVRSSLGGVGVGVLAAHE